MPKSKGKKKKKKSGLFKKYKEDRKKRESSKKKAEPFPFWLFLRPPELYPDPVFAPKEGWPIERMEESFKPRSPWLGSPSLNEHLAIPEEEPLREA